MIKKNVLSRKRSREDAPNIHALLLCPDPSRHLGDTYETIGRLGRGAFGEVFRVLHLPTKEERAVKVIHKPPVKEDLERVLTEVELLIELDHPNIMKFHEYFEDRDVVCLVTELCTGGHFGELNTVDNSLEEIRLLFRDVVAAVAYLHSEGVAHRDLKFENCLLTEAEHQRRRTAKVIDFGLSAVNRQGDSSSCWMSDPVGTVCFVAPEVLNGGAYGPECDIWSMGVMLYIVLTEAHPFAERAPTCSRDLVNAIKLYAVRTSPLEREQVDPAARDLLMLLLQKDPRTRIDARGALAHGFLHGASSPGGGSSPCGSPRVSEVGMKSLLDRLCSFAHFTRFERAILTLVAHEAQAREVEDLRAAFAALDLDHAGYLSRKEFRTAVAARGIVMNEDEMEAAVEALDPDGDDKIEYTDWLAATMSPSAITKETAMRELFNFFDIHGEGKVSKADLRDVLGEDIAQDVLRRTHHAKGSGSVSWPEFRVLIRDVARHLEECKHSSKALPADAELEQPVTHVRSGILWPDLWVM